MPDVKAAAKTEIDNAVGTDDSANVVAAADAAKSAIDSALSASAVTSAKNAGLSAIAAAKAENKDADDTAKANAVIAKIDAIGTVALTDASKAKIDAARSAYDALTTDQKAKITAAEYKKLTDAEAKYKELANAGKYEGVEPSSGHVKDITGTEDAPKETNHYSASIKNSSELETLLDVAAADKAQGVNVWIELVEAKDTMPAADKALIEKAAGTKTVGVFLDASLFKKVGDNDAEKVHELNGKIKVSLVVPENIRKTGRTYGIVRVHGGVATPIEGTFDAATHTFTFETDRFSSYALTYEDPASEESGEVAPPKTGDVNMAWVYMLMLLGTAWIGVACYRIKRN